MAFVLALSTALLILVPSFSASQFIFAPMPTALAPISAPMAAALMGINAASPETQPANSPSFSKPFPLSNRMWLTSRFFHKSSPNALAKLTRTAAGAPLTTDMRSARTKISMNSYMYTPSVFFPTSRTSTSLSVYRTAGMGGKLADTDMFCMLKRSTLIFISIALMLVCTSGSFGCSTSSLISSSTSGEIFFVVWSMCEMTVKALFSWESILASRLTSQPYTVKSSMMIGFTKSEAQPCINEAGATSKTKRSNSKRFSL
mmetsp:Transcript_23575/g.67534  ORF Transcript_23575/g.67534 Transcript_23575/m.67534 type:complete len:259 (+) Transcript_23575:304-1080(+)